MVAQLCALSFNWWTIWHRKQQRASPSGCTGTPSSTGVVLVDTKAPNQIILRFWVNSDAPYILHRNSKLSFKDLHNAQKMTVSKARREWALVMALRWLGIAHCNSAVGAFSGYSIHTRPLWVETPSSISASRQPTDLVQQQYDEMEPLLGLECRIHELKLSPALTHWIFPRLL